MNRDETAELPTDRESAAPQKGHSLPDGLLLSFYGDDFTGSTDTMEALAKAGLRTILFIEPPAPHQLTRFPGLRAVGVAGVSRSLSPSEMDTQLPPLFTQLKALDTPLFHVKICSTFDSSPDIGSIGRTIELGKRTFANTNWVPVIVGAPILNRFCLFGNLFARSGPESEVYRLDRHPTMMRHPVTPMRESDLRLHLAAQTTLPIGLIDVEQIDKGNEPLLASVESRSQAGDRILIFDTLTNSQLARIGRLLWESSSHTRPEFVVGSSGVEYALTAFWQEQGLLPSPPLFAANPVEQIVVVSGSCSPVTARQINWAVDHGFVALALDPVALLREANGETDTRTDSLAAALEHSIAALQSGKSLILHTCCGPDDPRITAVDRYLATEQSITSDRGPTTSTGRTLGTLLGNLLRTLVERSNVRRVVVAGGDTSGYAARAMDITALETVTPMAPGSPLCRAIAPTAPIDGLEILFKGGQVGKIDLFGSVRKGKIE